MCNPQALLNCVKNIKTANNTCIKSCNGLMITGYSKQEFDKNALETIENTVNAYKNYKKWFKFPQGIKGSIFTCITFLVIIHKSNFQTMNGRTN